MVVQYNSREKLLRIDGAGHALLPEKPEEIVDAVLAWLEGQ